MIFVKKLNPIALIDSLGMPFIGLIFMLCPIFCVAQPKRLFFNHLDQSHGLSQTTNNVVFKDSKGFVWISSLNGLNRYDGQKIKVYKYRHDKPYSLPDNYIQSRIIEDDSTNLWFTTHEALVCYVRKHNHFLSFKDTLGNGTPRKGYHLAFRPNNGHLGIIVEGTDFKTFDLRTRKWSFEMKFPSFMNRAIPIKNADGSATSLMVFNYDKPGLFFKNLKSSGKEWQFRFGGKNNEPAIYASDAVQFGDTMVVAAREGFLRLFLRNGKWDLFPTSDWYPNKLALFGKESMVVSLKGGGWQFVDRNDIPNGLQFVHDPNNPWSIASNTVYGVWEDYQGVIWTGVWGVGVDFTQPKKVKFNSLDLAELWAIKGNPVGIYSIAEDRKGNLWFSSRSSGIFLISGDKSPVEHFIAQANTGQSLPGNNVPYILLDSKGRSWAITWSGLGRLNPGDNDFHPVAPGNIYLHGIELKDNRLLFSNYSGGIDVLNETGPAAKMEKLAQFDASAFYTYLFENKKGLLFACRDLSSIEVWDVQGNLSLLKKLPIKGDIHYFCEDAEANELWIASSNGLVCLNQDTWEWNTLTEMDGLPDNQIFAIAEDNSKTLWLSTNRGLVRYYLNENRFHVFDIPDGLQGLEFNPHSFLLRSNGEFWFGGINGANIFHPDSISLIQTPPQVQFTRLWVNEEEVPNPECDLTKATNISEVKKLAFNYKQNTLGFEFAALEFSNPSKNTFQYLMDGYEKDWVKGGTKGFARYPNLPPGNYSFKVKAANSDGVWSEPKSIQVVIIPPIWQRWWFITLALLAFAFLVFSIYRYRVNQLLRVERLRNQISSDLHDDIGSTLSNVAILSTLIRQKFSTNKDVLSLLERIDEEVRSSSESLDDIIWSINPRNDPIDRILARMRRFATEVFEAKNINGNIDFSVRMKTVKINMDKRRHFFLLFKEAINNLAKYSNCKNAIIRVNDHNGAINLVVADDGIGFNPDEAKGQGNGLLTMQRRVEILRGTMEIQSAIGKGTKIRVSFPITENRDGRKG